LEKVVGENILEFLQYAIAAGVKVKLTYSHLHTAIEKKVIETKTISMPKTRVIL